jgi:hypothetical protein
MSHRHHCDAAGHDWQCRSRKCICVCGEPMHRGDHSRCPVELRACPKHRAEGRTNVAPAVGKTASKGVPIKFPPQHKLRRAMCRASRHADWGAFCVWCGHGYRLGRYTREAEDAHLLQCPSFPKEGKQRIREGQQRDRAKRAHAT